jgi:hypothetical protein
LMCPVSSSDPQRGQMVMSIIPLLGSIGRSRNADDQRSDGIGGYRSRYCAVERWVRE